MIANKFGGLRRCHVIPSSVLHITLQNLANTVHDHDHCKISFKGHWINAIYQNLSL